MLKCLIFDLDGTLMPTNRKHLKSLEQAFFRTTGVRLKDNEIIPLFGEPAVIIMSQLAKKHKVKVDLEKTSRLKHKLFRQSIKGHAGLSNRKREFLKRLRMNFLIALATGSSRDAIKVSLKPKDIKLFDFIVSAHDCRKGKPNPEIYRKVLKALKLKPSECLVVGDSPKDLIPARKLKVKSIGVYSGFNPKKTLKKHKPLAILNNVLELNKVLKKRFAEGEI